MDNPMNFFSGKKPEISEEEKLHREYLYDIKKQRFMLQIYLLRLGDEMVDSEKMLNLGKLPPVSDYLDFSLSDVAYLSPAIFRHEEPNYMTVLVLKDGRVLDQFGFERDDLRLI